MRNRSLVDDYSKYGIADGIQAIKVVRTHAAEWGISPERVVLTGFSAGAAGDCNLHGLPPFQAASRYTSGR
jgi:carboxylesterase type B